MAEELTVEEQRANLLRVAEMMDHMSYVERVDVLTTVATQAINEVLVLAEEVLPPGQGAFLRAKAEEEARG